MAKRKHPPKVLSGGTDATTLRRIRVVARDCPAPERREREPLVNSWVCPSLSMKGARLMQQEAISVHQQLLCCFVEKYTRSYGFPPSLREIAA